MGVELVPEAGAAEQEAVRRAIDLTTEAAWRTAPWWRAGLVDELERAPSGVRPSAYEAVRSPRSTLGATRA